MYGNRGRWAERARIERCAPRLEPVSSGPGGYSLPASFESFGRAVARARGSGAVVAARGTGDHAWLRGW